MKHHRSRICSPSKVLHGLQMTVEELLPASARDLPQDYVDSLVFFLGRTAEKYTQRMDAFNRRVLERAVSTYPDIAADSALVVVS